MATRRLSAWSLLLCCLVLASLSQPVLANEAQGELVAGGPIQFPPYYTATELTAEPTGFAIDIMREVGKQAGLSVQFQNFETWEKAQKALLDGRIDLIPNMGITEARQSSCDFTTPYETFHIHLFFRKGSNIRGNLEALAGLEVGAVATNRGEILLKKFGKANLHIYQSVEEALMALLSGNIAALAYPKEPLIGIALQSGLADRIHIVQPPLEEIMRAMAVRKGNTALLETLDQALQELLPSPIFQQIYSAWHQPPEPFWTMPKAITAMALLLIMIVAGLLFWRHRTLTHLSKSIRSSRKKEEQAETTIQTLVESMAGVTGQECLDHIVSGLCSWLKADYCIIGEITPEHKVRTLAMILDGAMQESTEYSMQGAPCEKVGQDGYCIFPEKVCSHFPDDQELVDLGAEGYIGTQLRDPEGRVIGVLNAISRHPFKLPPRVREAMDVLAGRAAAELNRRQTLERLEHELALNRSLAKLSNRLISATDENIDAIRQHVLDEAISLTNSKHGFVSSIDTKTGGWTGHAHKSEEDNCGVNDPQEQSKFLPRTDGTYPGLWGHALNTKEGFYTTTPQDHPTVSRLPDGHFPLEEFLSVPVIYGKELIGQIALANPEGTYTDGDLASINRLAELYALALQNQKVEEERNLLTTELRHAQKLEAIGTLAGGIAHDFNNILSAIMGYTELAKDELTPESQADHDLEEVIKASRRARDLVKQLLTFSRQTEQEMRPLQLSLLIKEACKLLRSSVPVSIEIKQNIDPESGSVLADPTQIHQLLINLVTNSVQALEDKGCIEIGLKETVLTADAKAFNLKLPAGQYVCLSVRDDGPGMDKTTLDRIFDPFFTTREVGRGSGMGLPVALGIIQKHKGSITVESSPGKGAFFQIYLPRFTEEPTVDLKEGEPLPTGNERILFVDDEAALTNMGKQLLERQGYIVTTETDSGKALELFRGAPEAFDIILTDQTMPTMSGLELSEQIRAIRPDMPIILCSGYSSVMSKEGPQSMGVNDFILKPLERTTMAKTVRRVLDNR